MGRLPVGNSVLILAAPVSELCLAGQLVSSVQGLQHSSIVDLKQLKKDPTQAHAQAARDSSKPLQDPSAQPETAEVLPASSTASSNVTEEQLRSGEDVTASAGNGILRLIVPGTLPEEHTNGCTDGNSNSQLSTPPVSEVKRGHSDSAVLSHPVHSMMAQNSMRSPSAGQDAGQEPENDHAAAQIPEIEADVSSSTLPSLPALSTSLIGRNDDVRSSYEHTPAVQEMVHGTSGAKGLPSADRDQSPSSGLLGMLVSMVSTSISPKRDESSLMQPANSAFQAASSNGSADAEELSETSGIEATGDQSGARSARPVLSPLCLSAARSSPNGSTPFDLQCVSPAAARI